MVTKTVGEGFSLPVRVYYEDTDASGVVYHANYLRFMERARTEWLRALGFGQDDLRRDAGVLFVVHDVSISYKAPARFDDAMQVTAAIARAGRSMIVFKQSVCRDDAVLTTAEVTVVCVNAQTFRPVSIPPAIRHALSAK